MSVGVTVKIHIFGSLGYMAGWPDPVGWGASTWKPPGCWYIENCTKWKRETKDWFAFYFFAEPLYDNPKTDIYNFWMGSWCPHVEDEHSVRNFRQNAYTACQTSTISSKHPDENLFERNIQMFSDIWIPFLTTFPTKQPEKIHQDEPSIGILSPSTIRRAVAGFVGKAVQSSCWRRIGGSRISWITLGGKMHFWYWK